MKTAENIGLYGLRALRDALTICAGSISKILGKRSKKPFESVDGKFTLFISLTACLVVSHSITQDWGDRMTLLALAIPGIVFLIYFIWNLANFHHKVHKDRTPALITILLFATVSLAFLFTAQFNKNTQLKKELNLKKLAVVVQKPLSTKFIPPPEPPVLLTATPPAANVITQEQFETFESSTGAIKSSVSFAKARMTELQQQQEAQKKATEGNTNTSLKQLLDKCVSLLPSRSCFTAQYFI